MKRTNLTSVVVLMSVVAASAVSPVVAGNRGGSGGKSFGGNGGFKMQSGRSMGTSRGNVVQKNFSHAGSTGIVGKLQHGSVQQAVKQFSPQNVTTLKKFQPAIQPTNTLKNIGISAGNLSKVSKSNVFTGNGSINNQNFKKIGNQSFATKFCGTGSFNNCHNKWWCSPIWWNYGCNWNYGCYNPCYFNGSYCNYYGSYCGYNNYCNVPYYTYPVTTGVATTTTPVVVNVNASDNNQTSAATTSTPKQPVETASTSNDDELREMTLGKTYDVRGTSFGETTGGLMLEVGEIALGVKVDQWTNGKISFTLPMFGLAKPMEARLHVMSSDGKPMQTTAVRLVLPAEMTASK